MSHLTLETLARLVDEAARGREEAHLEACAECREELEVLREQCEALRSLPKMMPAPEVWPELSARLRAEGLIAGAPEPARRPRIRLSRSVIRAAAGIVLFLGGGALGYGLRGAATSPADARVATAPTGSTTSAEQGGDAGDPATPDGGWFAGDASLPAGDAVDASTTLADPGSDPIDASGFAESTTDPGVTGLGQVERAEDEFLAALDRYMASSGTNAADPAARLAALDNIVLTTAEALNEAPADPVINSYYLTAVAQRNAVLRQIATSGGAPVF